MIVLGAVRAELLIAAFELPGSPIIAAGPFLVLFIDRPWHPLKAVEGVNDHAVSKLHVAGGVEKLQKRIAVGGPEFQYRKRLRAVVRELPKHAVYVVIAIKRQKCLAHEAPRRVNAVEVKGGL